MAKPTSDQLTLDQAYQAAFLWFDHKGEPPIEITEPAHGSVQLITETIFARVRWATHRAGQASVLAVLKSATDGKRVALFSASGFTAGAIAVAESQGVALYSFDLFGTAHAMTTHARSLQPDTPPDPPFAPELGSLWRTTSGRQPPGRRVSTVRAPVRLTKTWSRKGSTAMIGSIAHRVGRSTSRMHSTAGNVERTSVPASAMLTTPHCQVAGSAAERAAETTSNARARSISLELPSPTLRRARQPVRCLFACD